MEKLKFYLPIFNLCCYSNDFFLQIVFHFACENSKNSAQHCYSHVSNGFPPYQTAKQLVKLIGKPLNKQPVNLHHFEQVFFLFVLFTLN